MTTTPPEPDVTSVHLNFTERDSDSGSYQLRTLALGRGPLVIIEPAEDQDDESALVLDVDSTDLGTSDLADLLQLVVDALRQGEQAES